jgi:hypothetical protein
MYLLIRTKDIFQYNYSTSVTREALGVDLMRLINTIHTVHHQLSLTVPKMSFMAFFVLVCSPSFDSFQNTEDSALPSLGLTPHHGRSQVSCLLGSVLSLPCLM